MTIRRIVILSEKLERAKRFELSTPTLARLCSTPELRPLWRHTGPVSKDGPVGWSGQLASNPRGGKPRSPVFRGLGIAL